MLFIHQYPDWTNFRFARNLITDSLCRVRFLQGQLSGKSVFAISKEAAERVRNEDLQSMLSIDGYHEIPQAFISALRNFSLEMSEKRLLSLHAELILNGGHYREGANVAIGDYLHGFRGVSSERIPREIFKLITFFNESKMDAVLKAAIMHFWFLCIRPFEKGNGCIARLLSDMLLSKSENSAKRCYSLYAEITNDRNGYFETLFRSQSSNGEITEWILWYLNKMQKALDFALKKWTTDFDTARLKLSLGNVALTEREQQLVKHLQENSIKEISSSSWAEIADISHDSALRDFTNLVQKNILEKSNGKGRSTRYRLITLY